MAARGGGRLIFSLAGIVTEAVPSLQAEEPLVPGKGSILQWGPRGGTEVFLRVGGYKV